MDGTTCDPIDDTWDCCNQHGGRKKCPRYQPILCSVPNKCANGTDYCCAWDSKHCSEQDAGLPLCKGQLYNCLNFQLYLKHFKLNWKT